MHPFAIYNNLIHTIFTQNIYIVLANTIRMDNNIIVITQNALEAKQNEKVCVKHEIYFSLSKIPISFNFHLEEMNFT